MAAMTHAPIHFGNIMLGTVPRVVGTVSQPATLAQLATGTERDCDIVEIRLDLIGASTPHWIEQAKAIEGRGLPVIVTIRLMEEGGQWKQTDQSRLPLFESALRQLTSADIELRSPLIEKVSTLAYQRRRPLIVSYHDFKKTPLRDELRKIMMGAANYGSVVKIATFTKTEGDLAALRTLFLGNCSASICVLGMGPLGPQTRTEFPKLGSCLTYGYLDAPVAPGQVSARELMQELGGQHAG
jgi:3-dehydroquinate dehydratase-1